MSNNSVNIQQQDHIEKPANRQKTIKAPFNIGNKINEQGNTTKNPGQVTYIQNPFQTPEQTQRVDLPVFQTNQQGVPTQNDDFELKGNISLLNGLDSNTQQQTGFKFNFNQSNYNLDETHPFLQTKQQTGFSLDDNDDIIEPTLLEDLGIDIQNIQNKFKSVILFTKCEDQFIQQVDMSGPILIALALGLLLLLSGKIHFGYIYGFGIIGCLGVYGIMNLLGQNNEIPLYNTMSILGYCLLPLLILAGFNVILNFKNIIGGILSLGAVVWATLRATYFFEKVLNLQEQKWLIAYPILLFYSTFMLITIF